MRLYYYTGKFWGMKVLWERRVKIAQYKDVNDPYELLPFNLQRKGSRDFWTKKVAKYLGGHHGIICMSEDWASVLMWSHYGEKHTGLCLGFDVPDAMAEKMMYVDAPLDDPIDRKKALRGVTESVLERALRCKFAGWSYEKEWRLRARLENAVDGIFYKDFAEHELCLREVIIGARCSLHPKELADAVSSPPLDVEIFKARAAFGRFEICRQERIDTHSVSGYRARLTSAETLYADQLPDEPVSDDDDEPPW